MTEGISADPARFEARYSILAHAAVLALTLTLLVPAIWLLIAAWPYRQWFLIGLGAIGTLLFGFAALATLVRMADRRVRLWITEEAIWLPDHSQTPIPRRSIKKVSDRQLLFALYLHKPAKFPPTSRFRRFVKAINSKAALRENYGDVWIYPALFDCDRADLMSRI